MEDRPASLCKSERELVVQGLYALIENKTITKDNVNAQIDTRSILMEIDRISEWPSMKKILEGDNE